MNLKTFGIAFAAATALGTNANAQQLEPSKLTPALCETVSPSHDTWEGLYCGSLKENRQFLSYPLTDPDEARRNVDKMHSGIMGISPGLQMPVDPAHVKPPASFGTGVCKPVAIVAANDENDAMWNLENVRFAIKLMSAPTAQPAAVHFGGRLEVLDNTTSASAPVNEPWENRVDDILSQFQEANQDRFDGPAGPWLEPVFHCAQNDGEVASLLNVFEDDIIFHRVRERLETYAAVDDAIKQALQLKPQR